MSGKIEWGGTPGPFEVEAHPFDHDYKTHVVIPSRSGLPGQTIFTAEHNWNGATRGERRISWKEAEYNARAAKEIPAMVQALHQYANDLRYPPAPDSRERRLAMVEGILKRIEGND